MLGHDHLAHLHALRDELQRRELDGFLVPMADAYQSEYVPASDRRVEYLSGFTGSAGFIAVLADQAAFFTDSRYTLQASQQIPRELFSLHDSARLTPADWLKSNAGNGLKIGFDPRLHTAQGIERLRSALAKTTVALVPLADNPVDAIWPDRPAAPLAPVVAHDICYAGKDSASKRQELAAALRRDQLHAAVLTDPASIAWLLNVRGGDVPHVPLPLSYAILYDDARLAWFIDPRKLTPDVTARLDHEVTCCAPEAFADALQKLGADKRRVRIDPAEAAFGIVDQLNTAGAALDFGDDPCALPKACKNMIELGGMRAAHRRDGAALVKFLAWLDLHAPEGKLTELDVEVELARRRAEGELYCGPSFDTIAGAGPNAAVVHYRATPLTNRLLPPHSLFLLDSGGQYRDGTTDVTRTIAIGRPSDEMRDRFTRVLKGHIALAAIRFPAGITGAELDVLARQYLWDMGLDYGHGTGHGVGSYLSVHEGPQGISRRNRVALQPGMVLSNEPGFYKPGHYGIRIENLQVVVELPEISSSEQKFLGFEPLTLAPIDRRALATRMLTEAERGWLNAYHARVFATLKPLLVAPDVAWLEAATAEI